MYSVTIRIYDDESMKGWGWPGVGLLTKLDLSPLDYISQELVEHSGKGDSPLFAESLRCNFKLLIGLEYDSGLHILKYIFWYKNQSRLSCKHKDII